MQIKKIYTGRGSVQFNEEWHDCEYKLHLLGNEFQKTIEGTITTTVELASSLLLSTKGSVPLVLQDGKEVKAQIKSSNLGPTINVHVNGPIS